MTDTPIPPRDEDDDPEVIPADNTGDNTPAEWVTLQQASNAADVSVSALRKRIRGGDLDSDKDDRGRVLVDLAAVSELYGKTTTTPGAELAPLEIWERLDELHDRVAAAEVRAAVAEERERFATDRRQAAEDRARVLEAELDALQDDRTEPVPGWWRRLWS